MAVLSLRAARRRRKQRRDMLLLGGALWYLVIRRNHRSTRSVWTCPWLLKRPDLGAYDTLLSELRSEDQDSFLNFLRVSPKIYDDILRMVTPIIQRQDTNYRQSISPGLRLAITLRYLATGETFKSLGFLFRTGNNTIGGLVPETCMAIYNVLKDKYFQDSLKMALAEGDRPIQAKCYCAQADLQRRSSDVQKACARYESAMNILVEIGDRLGQIEVLSGMAKAMATMKSLAKAIEYYSKALELANSIGNKLHQYRCYRRMASLYRSLGDVDQAEICDRQWRRLQGEMELVCGVCSQPMAERPDKVEALPCYHLVHARCSAKLKREANNTLPVSDQHKDSKNCPKCLTAPPKTPTMG